ncbi:tetratricopeptide repeat protein [Actinomadura hibisca]|uniref:tetratricopeptide repeat protein n=1 Tax=Actinomadura hibisca TaxID=68565 RepID=UPI00082D202A|nr:tetratricopeptide repeat protein [Actinomadura hibisca]
MTGTRNAATGDSGVVVQTGSISGGLHLHPAPLHPAPLHHVPSSASLGRPAPMMVPPTPSMVDRSELVERLLRAGQDAAAADRPSVWVVSGAPGSGKSALVHHVAAALRVTAADPAAMPVLWTDLTDPALPADPALSAALVLGWWLRALGDYPPPVSLAEAAATFRTATAASPVAPIVVIDGVDTTAQIAPLLPARGLVLATSRRRRLPGYDQLPVDPLPLDAAVTLLTDLIGDPARRDPAAVQTLAACCAGLPLVLRLAAAHAVRLAPHPLSRVVELLSAPADPACDLPPLEHAVTEAIRTAARELTAPARRALLVLAHLPGAMFSSAAAGAALALDAARTDRLLSELYQADLVDHEDLQWWMRKQVTDYARTAAAQDEVDLEGLDLRVAVARAIRHYLLQAAQQDLVLAPGRIRTASLYGACLPPLRTAHNTARATAPADRRAALEWLGAWAPVIVAAQRQAAEQGLHALAWQAAEVMQAYLVHTKDYMLWRVLCRIAAPSARACADPGAQARIHMLTGVLERQCGDYDLAEQHYTDASQLFTQIGDLLGEASAAEHQGATLLQSGRHAEALPVLERGLALYQAVHHPRGQALLMRQLAVALSRTGNWQQATQYFATVDAVLASLDEPYLRWRNGLDNAAAELHAGHSDAARQVLDRIAPLWPDPSVPDRAQELCLRAAICLHDHDPQQARAHYDQATDLADAAALPDRHFVRTRLAEVARLLPPPAPDQP